MNQMHLLQGELRSSSETCVTSPQVQRVNDITEEDLQERTAVPAIKTEPKDCVEGETGSWSETCVTCGADGTEENGSRVCGCFNGRKGVVL